MTNEIEKKWLVAKDTINREELAQKAHKITALEQGYLDTAKADMRIKDDVLFCGGRQIAVGKEVAERLSAFIAEGGLADAEIRYRNYGADKSVLTVKGKGDLVRFEEEVVISKEEAEAFKKQAIGFVKKERFKIKDNAHTLEVDLYDPSLGFGFASVEVEFESVEKANAYRLPAYFGKAKDVTENKAFKNKNLAIAPAKAEAAFEELFARKTGVRKIASHHIKIAGIQHEKGE